MNFEHTEDRRMLADTLNRFVAEQYGIETRNHIAYGDTGTDPALWARFAELGAIGALFPEADGGFGGAGFDVAVVFEALGGGLVVEPFVGALVVGRALGLAGSATHEMLKPGVPSSLVRNGWRLMKCSMMELLPLFERPTISRQGIRRLRGCSSRSSHCRRICWARV